MQCRACLANTSVLLPKNKLMAWFVSHCETHSRRERYVAKLSQFIPVDIYGHCGNKTTCSREHRADTCTDKILKNYKFYFVGENAICKDYFTGRSHYVLSQSILAHASSTRAH